MRFTIRDLLWLTVVVALGVAWWVDRGRLAKRIKELTTIEELTPNLDPHFYPGQFRSDMPQD